jgi:hypothetical protein
MEIFLMVLSLSLVGVLVSAVLFAAASRDGKRAAAGAPLTTVVGEERFFVLRQPRAESVGRIALPSHVLALQIERHVRLEQAAAEGFLQLPSVEALHTPTLSPLVG